MLGQGIYPCVLKEECKFCNSLTSEQKSELVTLSYEIKKEKSSEKADKKDSGSEPITLVDPDLMSVIEAVKSPEKVKEMLKSKEPTTSMS